MPGGEKLDEKSKDDKGDDHESKGNEQPFDPRQFHLVGGQAPEALRKELPADYDIPSGAEDPELDEQPADEIESFHLFLKPETLITTMIPGSSIPARSGAHRLMKSFVVTSGRGS
jgi:hypothetical protein